MHEKNTKEITTVAEVLNQIKICVDLHVFIGSIKEVNVEQGSLRSPLTGDCLPGFVAP